MLDKYFHPEDWHQVYFKEEIYFSYGAQNEFNIIPKLDMRYCHYFVQEIDKPAKKDKKRYHE